MLWEILNGLGYALDTPGALTRGALAGRPGERVGGREMLESWGLLGENQEGLDWGDAAGFGAEMIADPLNFIGGGMLAKAMGLKKGISAANDASMAQRAMGFMPEEIAKQTKLVDEATGLPQRMYHGTPYGFDKYSPDSLSDSSLFGPGIYTTADPHVASGYASKFAGRQVSGDDVLNYYQPGKIVDSYAGQDEVLEVLTYPTGEFKGVKVQRVLPPGVHESLRERPRIHATYPSAQQVFADELAPSVKMQYLDLRNPFSEHGSYTTDDLYNVVRQFGDVEGEVTKRINSLPGQAGRSVPGEEILNRIQRFSGNTMPSRRILENAGFDGILHDGGKVMGTVPHDVAIAFDPSQVYAPYIAPALQDVPRTSPILASLLGYNAATTPHRIGR